MEQAQLQSAAQNNEIVVKYSWFMEVLLGLDQLGNSLAGGHHDSTVSARIGFHLYDEDGARGMYWSFLEFVVNLTFSPVDGPHHCRMAYCSDRDEKFRDGGFFAKLLLLFLVLLACGLLILPILLIGIFRAAGTSYYLSNGERIPKKEVYQLIAYCLSENDPCAYLQKLR
ncbi:MAG: hypothetical protein AAF717_19380 [Bacteroidota bacterium]